MPAPSAIRQNIRFSGYPSMEIEINRPKAKAHGHHQRSSSRSRPVPHSRSQMPLERSRSNDSRHDDEYSIRDEYCDDLRDNNDDYSTIADYSTVTEEEKPGDFGFSTKFFPFPTIADYSTVTEEEKPDDFGFSTKFFCCDSTMSWGFRLGKEDEDAESEKNIKRGIIPHFPQRGRSLARTDPFPRGRGKSLSRTDERRGRSHSRSRSFYGAKSTSSAKKFKGLFSNLSRKKASTGNKEIAPSIPPTNVCDASDSSSLAKAEIERLKSQLTDLKKAEEERRRQAELLEAATNATNEGEKRTFAEAAALAAEAATKALDDEETKRAAGALLAHQMEEDETNVDKETAENNTSNVSTENGSEGTSTDLDMKAKLRSLRTILSSKCCIDDVQDAIDNIISSSEPIDQKDAETTDDIAQDAITKRVLSNEPIDLLDGPPSELNRERSDVTTSDTSASIRIHSDCHATELQLASADDNSILEEVVATAGVEEAVDVGTGIDERDVAARDSIDRGGRDVAMQEEGGRQQTANRKRSDSSTSDTSASTESENSFIFVDGSYTDGLSLDNEDVHDEHPLVTRMDKIGGVKLACDPFPFIDCVDDAAFHSVVCSPCRGCFDEQSQSDEQCQSSVSEVSASGEGRGRLRSTSPNAADDSEQPTLLAVEAATKALDDEETKWAAGALLAHQMEEDHEASLDQNKQEDEDVEDEEEGRKISPDTTISKDSTKVETNVKKETAENNTSNVSTENGSEGTDSEHNEYQEKKASELKEKKRKEEAAREKKALELKEKKRKEEAAREKKASELKEKKAAQKERKRMAAKEKKAKKLSKKGQKKRAAKLAATEDHFNKDAASAVASANNTADGGDGGQQAGGPPSPAQPNPAEGAAAAMSSAMLGALMASNPMMWAAFQAQAMAAAGPGGTGMPPQQQPPAVSQFVVPPQLLQMAQAAMTQAASAEVKPICEDNDCSDNDVVAEQSAPVCTKPFDEV